MELCDLTGDTDFDYFNPSFGKGSASSIQDALNKPKARDDDLFYNFYQQENERLLFDVQLSRIRPLLDDTCSLGGPEDNDRSKCTGNETSVSQEFPPQYPKLQTPDPFMFLKSRNKTQGRRVDTNGGIYPSDTTINANEGCNHDEPSGNRRFILSFDRSHSAADRSDQCYAAERDRCMEFWQFVNETPELVKVIKDGKFVHKSSPNVIHCVFPEEEFQKEAYFKKKPPTPPPKYTPEMKALRKRNEEVHRDIQNRRQRLHELTMSNRRKSGQLSIGLLGGIPLPKQPKQPSLTTICGPYADCRKRDVNEVFAEMEKFDQISKSPVKTACDLRKIPGPCEEQDQVPFLGEGYDENIGEGDKYFDDIPNFSYFGEQTSA